jgi:hypothetical protein
MKKSELRLLIREQVTSLLKEVKAPISLKGKHESGSIVVAIFFDHTKQANNSKQLWSSVIEFAGDPETNLSLVKYFVTDSVVEFEFRPKRRGRYDAVVREMESRIEELQNMFTSYDIYTI